MSWQVGLRMCAVVLWRGRWPRGLLITVMHGHWTRPERLILIHETRVTGTEPVLLGDGPCGRCGTVTRPRGPNRQRNKGTPGPVETRKHHCCRVANHAC